MATRTAIPPVTAKADDNRLARVLASELWTGDWDSLRQGWVAFRKIAMQSTFTPQHLEAFAAALWTWSVEFLPRLVTALIILIVGLFIVGRVSRTLARALAGAHAIDETVRPLLASIVRYGLALLVIVLALGQLGVQTASLLTVLGTAGLAIGLALQGTLSNIAAGIMLLFLRPFKVGDYIEVVTGNAISGTVLEIGLFGCLLRSYDGILVFAPNGTIWNNPLKNHTRNAGRLVSVAVTVEDSADAERARAALLSMMRDDPRIHREPPPDAFIENYGPNGVVLNCRAWASPSAVGAVQRTLIEETKDRKSTRLNSSH